MRRLRHLMIAILAGGLIWVGDVASGRHLERGLGSFADRLGVWYETRRMPGYPCSPGTPVPYKAIDGIVFEVPSCWKTEVVPFLGREVHRFQDPDAKAGNVSISVEPAVTAEDRDALKAEFEALAARPGAIVDGIETAPAGGADRGTRSVRPSISDSLAARLEREAIVGAGKTLTPAASGGAGDGGPGPPVKWIHRVRTRGRVGATTNGTGGEKGISEAAFDRNVWSWLLIGDLESVRIVYSVRDDWTDDSVIIDEFEDVRKLVNSVRPAR